MKVRFIIWTLALVGFTTATDAQEVTGTQEATHVPKATGAQEVKYSMKKIEDIASQLPPAYLVEKDSIIPCPDICKNKSIVVVYNEKRQISHLGISMFSKEMKEIINPEVCDFIERLFLELMLEDDKNVISMLDRNKIVLSRNGIAFGEGRVTSIPAILQEIEEPALFSLTKKDLDSYAAVWEYGHDNMLVVSFPSNRELISGTNKKESDDLLHDQLKENNCHATTEKNIFIRKETMPASSYDPSVYISKGDTFMLKAINEDTYYKKTAAGYELIYDRNFPHESLSNLFYWHYANSGLKIHVKHSMYGNFSPEFEMKFADFICFFKNDFNIYTASFQNETGELYATVIFQNKQYNYIHVLSIRTTAKTVFDKNGVLMASFTTNIPQHNIKSLIGDLTKNK